MNPPSDVARSTIVYGICLALRYLHSLQPVIMHGDSKPVYIMEETLGPYSHEVSCRAKLLDLCLARDFPPHKKAAGGTREWCAPELVTAPPREASPTTDTYSLESRLFRFDLEALTAFGNRHRALAVARKQHYT